ncbi:MAG: putative transposase [Lentisphaeria bacterium]|jgi:putative transposase
MDGMSNYRRMRTEGGTYFFTVVTYRRRPIFVDNSVVDELRKAIKEVKQQSPFVVDAWVVLPDHMHCVWSLPEGDADYSKRMGQIKSNFTRRVKGRFHQSSLLTDAKQRKRESTIWQRRFWEHEIRDQVDFENHINYVHYNPVKHGLVKRIADWPYSTFHKYVENGIYSNDWSGVVEMSKQDYGE